MLAKTSICKIKVKEIKITANGNLLIFPSTLDDKLYLLDDKLLFPDLQKLDLDNSNNKKFLVMVKGINATDFKDKFNNFESDFECNDVHEIKNKDNRILQM